MSPSRDASTIPTRPLGRTGHSVTLFALGGDYYGAKDAVEAFDIEGGSWSAAEPMATPRMYLAAVAGP